MFIPRHPVVEDQFCQFNAVTTGSGATIATAGGGGVLAYAGSVCYLDDSQNESIVKIYLALEDKAPFGFLMQKVKVGYHSIHPAGFMMPGDLGSSDAIAQPSYNTSGVIAGAKATPVGVAHLGIWDTIHYSNSANNGPTGVVITAGMSMVVANSHLSEIAGTAGGLNTTTNGGVAVARVLKGATAAQVTANTANTTLYAIRVKLLV